MKKMVYGSVVVLAVVALVMGCSSSPSPVADGSGRPVAANENWNPDAKGNLQITNMSGRNVDIFVNGRYIRSIEKGRAEFLINVTDATSAVGFEFIVTVYDNGTKKSLDEPAESAKMNVFFVRLFPADDVDRRMSLVVPESEWRDTDAVAAGKALVKFEYPVGIYT